ncbi:MAG: DUF3048 domain-containing protein [Acidimicrobiales bacterium]
MLVPGAGATSLALTMGSQYAISSPLVPGVRSALPVSAPSGPACPLSGEPASGGKVPQRPALAVKIDNYPDARPQSGLDEADVVFEEPVEGGITRLAAVFQCNSAALVGPIRSAREVDTQILDELSNPIFVHVGGIAPVLSLIADADDIDENISNSGPPVQNPPGRYPPYDTYISTSAGWGLQPSDTTPPAPIFTYSDATPAGAAVTSVQVPFSGTNDNTWTWNPGNGLWNLSIGGVPATDTGDGDSPVGVANVVVQTVNVSYGPWAENSLGALEVESQLVGSGPLEVFRNGLEVNGTWERSSLHGATKLVARDGNTIALQAGETWVELVPSSVKVTTGSTSAGSTSAGSTTAGSTSAASTQSATQSATQ